MSEGRLLDLVAELFRVAQRTLVVTGAGMSADSGLPTYRGIGGLYESESTAEGVPIEEALSGDMLRRNPALSWKYIHQIESACRGARFHSGHAILAELERTRGCHTILTQNVDGFHTDAGSKNVIEIHGNLRHLACTECDYRVGVDSYAELEIPPRCPECGELVRPDVVLFGEALPRAALERLALTLESGVDLVVVIGTTPVFPYIAAPVVHALRAGVPTVELNPGDSVVSDMVDHHVRLGARRGLEEIWERLTGSRWPPASS